MALKTSLPILYSFRRCPYAMRARMALRASDTACELREVKLAAKPQALRDVSPKATVPVLVTEENLVIEESLEIMFWALRRNDPLHWLPERSPLAHAPRFTQDFISRNDGAFKRDLDAYKYPDRHPQFAVGARERGLSFLFDIEHQLETMQTGFLLSDAPTLVDIAIFPFVRQFSAVDAKHFETLAMHRLKTWLAYLIAMPLFESIMQKHEPWSPREDTSITVF